MAGYQGWFNAPDDGAHRGWFHYANRGKFQPGDAKIDLWPDVSEYPKTYKTPFLHADGSAAYVFSSYDASSVDLHFKWMQQYGVDGVFVQRFVTNIKNRNSLHHNNTVLSNALEAAQTYHRAIAVMYDLSGMQPGDEEMVMNDWKQLVDSLRLTTRGNRQPYLYHKGKPLVAIWGVGFNDHRAYGTREVAKIIDFLKHDALYGGCSILLGVPGYWRDLGRDTEKDSTLYTLYQQADIIHPWLVGRYNEDTYQAFLPRLQADVAWCQQHHVDYVPTVFPGFSWHNMYEQSPMNQTPRNKGQFYWKQLIGAMESGARMLYIAMFDEVDEGTAIFKIAKDPPVGLSHFVTFEKDVPNDYYLFLTGMAAGMLRKQIPLQVTAPKPVK